MCDGCGEPLARRDLFAAMALQGLLAGRASEFDLDEEEVVRLADLSVSAADALVERLSKDREVVT